jgi:hypothetical protein
MSKGGNSDFFAMIDSTQEASGGNLTLQVNDEAVIEPTKTKPTHKKKKSSSSSPKKRGSKVAGGADGLVNIPAEQTPESKASVGSPGPEAALSPSKSKFSRRLPVAIIDLTWDRIYCNIDVPLPLLNPIFEELRDYRVIKAWHVSSKSPKLW